MENAVAQVAITNAGGGDGTEPLLAEDIAEGKGLEAESAPDAPAGPGFAPAHIPESAAAEPEVRILFASHTCQWR